METWRGRFRRVFLGASAAVLLGSCLWSCRTPKDVTYFRDLSDGDVVELRAAVSGITVRPGDRLSVVVVSKDPQLASLFNLPLVAQRVGQPGVEVATGGSNEVASYVVDTYGDIQFPVLGTLHVGGMRRAEVAEHIRGELVGRNLVKDPVVVVDFLNLGVPVLGEVNRPGRVTFDRDRFTLLDALAGAGDLTIQGRRTDVLVLRSEGGRETAYRVDLTDARSLMSSPAYSLRQGDAVYVSPNDVRSRQTTANGSTPLTPGFWISIASLLTTVAVLIWK